MVTPGHAPTTQPGPDLLGRLEGWARQLDWPRDPLTRLDWIGAGALTAMLLLLLIRGGGKGDLAVVVELPPARRGTFSVRVGRMRERRRPRLDALEPENRASTRFEHFLIARETHFQAIPARSYVVVLEGVVENREGQAREAVLDDRDVRVEKGRTARVIFDLRPRECLLEVHLLRGGRPARDGRVALGGDPTSLRLAREGLARLSLGTGHFKILAGGEGRAVEQEIEIQDFERRSLAIDLDDPTLQVFAHCQAAVEPFLRGDLSVAAQILEREGLTEQADLLAARFHRRRGATDTAACRFEAAGRLIEAAELRAQDGDAAHAAELFERGGDPARAAEMYEAAGDLLRAGHAHEEAGDLTSAIAAYRSAGETPRLLDVLEKAGELYEAGQLALQRGETPRAVRSLQQVDARDPHYCEACRILADLFQKQGKPELAVQKADEAMTFQRPDETSPQTFLWYGDLLDKAGRSARALQVFEELRERSPEQPDVDTRIESLRKSISAKGRSTAPTLAVPSAFGADSRYEILEEIGCGGMGVVFRARDRRLGREVALKRLPDSIKDHPRAVELFLREARAAAALNHPNIVTLHDVDQENGSYFITMELLQGSTLAQVLKARGRVGPLDTCRLGQQIATGLGYAHERRIIHRDIKTANLFFTHDKIVKVMDFGLAKSLEEVRRATTVVGGTPYYMAPEQASGDNVDHRTDLYAFGVTLFELLTGHRPFEEGDIAFHHRHTPAPDPRIHGVGMPEALAELVVHLLAKKPEDRIQSADQAGQQLHAVAGQLTRKS